MNIWIEHYTNEICNELKKQDIDKKSNIKSFLIAFKQKTTEELWKDFINTLSLRLDRYDYDIYITCNVREIIYEDSFIILNNKSIILWQQQLNTQQEELNILKEEKEDKDRKNNEENERREKLGTYGRYWEDNKTCILTIIGIIGSTCVGIVGIVVGN